MKLYDLVTLKKRLQEVFNIDNSVNELSKIRDQLSNLDRDIDKQYSEFIQIYVSSFNESIIEIQHQYGHLPDLIHKIDEHIAHITHELYSESYDNDLRTSMMNHQVRLSRSSNMPNEARELIKDRLRNYNDWHYPGLELGCRTGEWTQHLVGSDPLYIVDLDQQFLDLTASQFAELYQSRLRKYVIKFLPLVNEPNLNILPTNQFGFIFSWEFFNYIALSTARYYLEQCMQLLRPGGIMMFSYNDGDTPNGAAYAENGAQSYLPKSKLIQICNQLGFQIINEACYDNGVINWLELKKPGELSTIKSHQSLGEIIRLQH
jgi:SAM-dependent methyltransferase